MTHGAMQSKPQGERKKIKKFFKKLLTNRKPCGTIQNVKRTETDPRRVLLNVGTTGQRLYTGQRCTLKNECKPNACTA